MVSFCLEQAGTTHLHVVRRLFQRLEPGPKVGLSKRHSDTASIGLWTLLRPNLFVGVHPSALLGGDIKKLKRALGLRPPQED